MKIMIPTRHRARTAALALCALAISTVPMRSQATQDAPPPAPPQSDSGAPPAHPRMAQMQERHLEIMTRHLSLTADQVSQVKAIDSDGMTRMMALRQDTSISKDEKRERMKAIHEGQTAKIRAILTDDQKPKFDAMVAHERERMEHRREGDGQPGEPLNPPPPPPSS